ncbi:lysophospholipid acyltransferase family protein [Planctomycetota bacterium]|nr:lysophospholipid acyltransferase family protein [Planctomycetota bacterium]
MSVAREKKNWSSFLRWQRYGDTDPSDFTLTEKLKFWGVSGAARLWMNAIWTTCNITCSGHPQGLVLFDSNNMAKAKEGAIILGWHNRVAGQILFLGHRKRQNQALQIDSLVSASRDGELIARIVRDFNAGIIRGSSSRDAATALKKAVKFLLQGHFVASVADGPRGPRYVAKPGPILMAKESGRPIVPFTWHCTRTLQLYKSWDQLMVPLPRAKLEFVFGEPMFIDKKADARGIARARRELQKRLMKQTGPADDNTIITRLIPKPKPGHLLKRRKATELSEHRK